MVFAGELGFNPEVDYLEAADGSKFKFTPPTGDELPTKVILCRKLIVPLPWLPCKKPGD